MTIAWGAVNARARGLATHLLNREDLLSAAGAGSWHAATRALIARGFPVPESGRQLTPYEFDHAAGRVLAGRFAVLGRWLGPGHAALSVLYEEIEYRLLRRLLRGSAQGAPPGARLRGATPTPGLPARTLEPLAKAESPRRLAEALVRLGHPAGRALLVAGTGLATPDLWRLEAALARLFALRVTRAARRAGPDLRRFAAMLIDLANVESLLLLREWGAPVSADDVFLPGGLVLNRTGFAAAAGLGADRLGAVLSEWFAGTPLEVLGTEPNGPGGFEARALGALLAWQRREARRNPLGPGVLLEVLERMRAEAHDVRLVSGAADLGAPPGLVAAGLVTPA